MGFSEEDYQRILARQSKAKEKPKKTGKEKLQALGRLKVGQQNKTELSYEQHLTWRMHLGEVLWFKFEGIKLRLADNTFYTPDYAVMTANSVMELHEVKGVWLDDARVKIKVAAEMYPFRFIGVKAKLKKDGGGWEFEDFSRGQSV